MNTEYTSHDESKLKGWAKEAGLWPNTIHSWMGPLTRYTNLVAKDRTAASVASPLTQEPVAWQRRYIPTPGTQSAGPHWFDWVLCSKEEHDSILAGPKIYQQVVRALYASPQPAASVASGGEAATGEDPDGVAFRTAASLGLTLRFYGGCAQSGMPGSPSAYEVSPGQDRAEAMRASIERAAAVIAGGGESQRLLQTDTTAQPQPRTQAEPVDLRSPEDFGVTQQQWDTNTLNSVADWLDTRKETTWATRSGYTGLMGAWANDLRSVLSRHEAQPRAQAEPSGNWLQFAKEGESAEDVIVRERKDNDALCTLLAQERAHSAEPVTDEVLAAATDLDRLMQTATFPRDDVDLDQVATVVDFVLAAGRAAPPVEPSALVPGQKITEEMHCAAVKVLHRATGVDGLPQRMLDAMFAAAPSQQAAPTPATEGGAV